MVTQCEQLAKPQLSKNGSTLIFRTRMPATLMDAIAFVLLPDL